VASWYDNIYKPLVEIFRESRILRSFPGRTEADLYVWVANHLYYLRERYGEDIGLRQAALDFAKKYKLHRFLRFLNRLD